MDRIVGGHYRLRRKIGAGSFGEIYRAENTQSHRLVAVKLESVRTRVPQLSYESKLYTILAGGVGIPRIFFYGTEESHNVLIMELLGKSLEDLFVVCHQVFSLKTVLMLADQMISCVEFMHNKNFIHRDIKPDNFVMGLGSNSNQVYVIDFGLSKKYRDQHTHIHIPYIEGKSLTGTARYASVNSLKGIEQSRRDDMEGLGYVWLYLLRGNLPWMGQNGRDRKQKYDRICEVKSKTSFEELCSGFPNEFVKYFYMIRQLHFTDVPDYAEYRRMFRELFSRLGYIYDSQYDWTPLVSRTGRPGTAVPLPKREPAFASKTPPFPVSNPEIPEISRKTDQKPLESTHPEPPSILRTDARTAETTEKMSIEPFSSENPEKLLCEVAAVNRTPFAGTEKAEKTEKTEKVGKVDQTEKAEKIEKAEKTEKVGKLETKVAQRVTIGQRPERVETTRISEKLAPKKTTRRPETGMTLNKREERFTVPTGVKTVGQKDADNQRVKREAAKKPVTALSPYQGAAVGTAVNPRTIMKMRKEGEKKPTVGERRPVTTTKRPTTGTGTGIGTATKQARPMREVSPIPRWMR